MNENASIAIKISLKFVSKGPINNIPALVQTMAWRRPGDKPLSEPMMVSLPTHICVTRPQWLNHLLACASHSILGTVSDFRSLGFDFIMHGNWVLLTDIYALPWLYRVISFKNIPAMNRIKIFILKCGSLSCLCIIVEKGTQKCGKYKLDKKIYPSMTEFHSWLHCQLQSMIDTSDS